MPASIVPWEHVVRMFLGVLADHLALVAKDSLMAVAFLCTGNNTNISLAEQLPMLNANGQHGRSLDNSHRSKTHSDRGQQRLDRGAARNPRQCPQTGRACQGDQGNIPHAARSQAQAGKTYASQADDDQTYSPPRLSHRTGQPTESSPDSLKLRLYGFRIPRFFSMRYLATASMTPICRIDPVMKVNDARLTPNE